jgi:hypothetical protein
MVCFLPRAGFGASACDFSLSGSGIPQGVESWGKEGPEERLTLILSVFYSD